MSPVAQGVGTEVLAQVRDSRVELVQALLELPAAEVQGLRLLALRDLDPASLLVRVFVSFFKGSKVFKDVFGSSSCIR